MFVFIAWGFKENNPQITTDAHRFLKDFENLKLCLCLSVSIYG